MRHRAQPGLRTPCAYAHRGVYLPTPQVPQIDIYQQAANGDTALTIASKLELRVGLNERTVIFQSMQQVWSPQGPNAKLRMTGLLPACPADI